MTNDTYKDAVVTSTKERNCGRKLNPRGVIVIWRKPAIHSFISKGIKVTQWHCIGKLKQ